jgi:hypothetical protein
MKVKITTAAPLEQTPVRIHLLDSGLPQEWDDIVQGTIQLRLRNGSAAFPVQVDPLGSGIYALLTMPVGTSEFEFESVSQPPQGVALREGEEQLEILLPDGPFGTYHYKKTAPRPYIWPLYGPGGVELTRAFPMENRPHEKHDHPHHRSLWTAFDEVNGVNNWHEGEGHGWTRHQKFYDRIAGPVYGGFVADLLWTDVTGQPLLDEMRIVKVYNVTNGLRLFDYTVIWYAKEGDVTFGDTKEAGAIAIRVATSMDGERGGVITNSNGGRGEKECWGKQADWCDYTGEVNGEKYGISIFNSPNSSGGAPRWHVRDYGLFATNPFSVAAFEDGEKRPFVLHKGESVQFLYRVLLHKGEATESIKQTWEAWKNPPLIEIEA